MSPAKLFDRESIIDAIREYARIYGRPPGAQDWNVSMARANGRPDLAERFYADGCWPHTGTVMRNFPKWNDAIRAAGFQPKASGQRYTERGGNHSRVDGWSCESIIEAIQRWVDAHGDTPTSIEWRTAGSDHPSVNTVRIYFRTWNTAIVAAGFLGHVQGQTRRWNATAGGAS